MKLLKSLICLGTVLNIANALAQNTFPSSGNVGIGTTSPSSPLSIVGSNNLEQLQIQSTSSGGHSWGIASFGTYPGFNTGGLGFGDYTAGNWRMYLDGSGNVGISTTSPSYTLDVNGKTRVESNGFSGVTFEQQAYPNQGALLFSSDRTGYTFILGNKRSSDGNVLPIISMYDSGNVGIGTTSPQAKLEVNGNLRFTVDGSVQTTAWTGVLCGGDYAESVDVKGDRTKYGPGDVLVIDPDGSGRFLKSAEPYSTSVLGIYSTKPGALGRRQTTPKSGDEIPMAMIGIVPTKASAENGPIKPGDLLVTSSTPGYAMKGTDRSRLVGAVIGKAMGRLDSGTGVIEVGVTLQ